ncbi:MGMT family protein [Acerihabitans sp. KWT182]|uniref:MGMT family protein n=1 Tax=Acerihabitans sp. KWT182 TaxID=3157919 RepID=A0AAU7QD88_9GAMM
MDESTDSFRQRVFQIVAAIPAGCITTYGEVALLAGSPRAARQVGGILSRLPRGTKLPWHRVLNRHGGISLPGEGFQRQKSALEAEGIEIDDTGTADLSRYRWRW